MSVVLSESRSFLEVLGINYSEKKMERLFIIEKIKNNPTFINEYAQKVHERFGIMPKEICAYIRSELVEHGLPTHALDKLDSNFKDTQKQQNRLGKMIKTSSEDIKMSSEFASIMKH